jgi:hypothetical protein
VSLAGKARTIIGVGDYTEVAGAQKCLQSSQTMTIGADRARSVSPLLTNRVRDPRQSGHMVAVSLMVLGRGEATFGRRPKWSMSVYPSDTRGRLILASAANHSPCRLAARQLHCRLLARRPIRVNEGVISMADSHGHSSIGNAGVSGWVAEKTRDVASDITGSARDAAGRN